MKYKNIQLKEGNEFESELCIGVEFNEETFEEFEIKDKIFYLLKQNNIKDFGLEFVMDDYVQIRNIKESMLHEGSIALLKNVYDILSMWEYFDVYVDIHTDDWFGGDDGESYNNEMVKWDEFIINLEY